MLELDNKPKYASVFKSKNQFLVEKKYSIINDIDKIIKVINKHSNIDFNWSQKEKTSLLKNSDLSKIEDVVSNLAQNELVKILGKHIEPHIKSLFGDRLKYNIRVSAQIKSPWELEEINKPRIGFFNKNIFYEHSKKSNISFPTRAHQDLDNNGNRSSHILIFYFPLTEFTKRSSVIEFGKFENGVGLFPFSAEWGYPNEISHRKQKKINWINPDLTPGNMILMTAFTPHRSSKISQIPRIALNVKIQPTNLDYINCIYKISLNEVGKLKSLDYKLNFIKDVLKKVSEKSRISLFELSIVYFLKGNKRKAKETLSQLCLFDADEKMLERWLVASISRKFINDIKEAELIKLSYPIDNVVEFSCGYNILTALN